MTAFTDVILGLLLGGAPAVQEAAPKPKAAPATVYDESADARTDLKAALSRAKQENRRVLVQWGANWCGWCVALHGLMTSDNDVAKELRYEYDVVRIDVGRFDKNMDLAKELGANFKAIPYLTLLDADGKALVQQNTELFENVGPGKASHDPKKLLDFLKEHQAAPLDATVVRSTALARAKAEKKRLFLHFGAPWCGWCHRLENWMAQPAVAALLAKDFVDVKIDTDRMVHGDEVLKSELARAGSQPSGIPWFVFLDADDGLLAVSERANDDGTRANIGFPYEEKEIAQFVGMLDKACVNLTQADVETLRASLVTFRAELEKQKKPTGSEPR